MARRGILVVLSGPSGAGKGTICKELLQHQPNLHYSISATTRPPRIRETNGVNYWFLSETEFRAMVAGDELLEWAEVYGNCYGTPRRNVIDMLHSGKDVVLEIDTQGAMKVKAKFPEGVFIYIMPPSLTELATRITNRGTDSAETITRRLNCVKEELPFVRHYDYVVVNGEVEAAMNQIAAIIAAEKCRVERNDDLIRTMVEYGQVELTTEGVSYDTSAVGCTDKKS